MWCNHGMSRRSGLSKLGRHNVKRAISVRGVAILRLPNFRPAIFYIDRRGWDRWKGSTTYGELRAKPNGAFNKWQRYLFFDIVMIEHLYFLFALTMNCVAIQS